jgi:hypothetical protein
MVWAKPRHPRRRRIAPLLLLGVLPQIAMACTEDETDPGPASGGEHGDAGDPGTGGGVTPTGGAGAAPQGGAGGTPTGGAGAGGDSGNAGAGAGGDGGAPPRPPPPNCGGEGGEQGCPCNWLGASSTEARIGERVELYFDQSDPSVDRFLEFDSEVTGMFGTDDEGTTWYECRSAGTVTLSIRTVNGPCDEIEGEIELTCNPLPGQDCCPIDELMDSGCMQFGGSPPCYTGCECLSEGGVTSLEYDQNQCLQWQIELNNSGEPVVCYDEEGNVHPDPRGPLGGENFCAPVRGDMPSGSCAANNVRGALENNEPPPDPNPDRECDPTGTWQIEVPEDCPLEFTCADVVPDLEFTAPGDFEVSDNGCELDLVRTGTWSNTSECGAYGYRVHLIVDGDSATGRTYRAESGLCSGHTQSSVTATRID